MVRCFQIFRNAEIIPHIGVGWGGGGMRGGGEEMRGRREGREGVGKCPLGPCEEKWRDGREGGM